MSMAHGLLGALDHVVLQGEDRALGGIEQVVVGADQIGERAMLALPLLDLGVEPQPRLLDQPVDAPVCARCRSG